MKRFLIAAFVLMFVSVIAVAGDTQWQLDKTTLSKMSVDELVAASDSLRAQKHYNDAARVLSEAVRRQPKDATIVNKLGLVEIQLRDYWSAKVHFKQAMKLDAKFADATNNLGAAFFLQNDLRNAERYYKKALALDDNRATFHVNMAVVWERQNKLDLALAEYQRALELNPDALTTSSANGAVAQLLTPEQRASRYFILAKVCAIRGDIEGSLEYLRKAKEESYRDLRGVYKQQEFAKLWSDPRLGEIVPSGK